jgi:hypothetical protein
MNKILRRRISNYPHAFRDAIARFSRGKTLNGERPLRGETRRVNDVTRIEQESLRKTEAIWALSFFSTCTMVAAAQFEQNGEISKGFAGHFGVNEVEIDTIRLLKEGEYDPSKTAIFMAGMSQRASKETLRRACEELSRGMQEIGFPNELFWSSEDYPHFYNPKGEHPVIVSDMGLGLDGSRMMRTVYAGFTINEMIMLSLHCNEDMESRRMNVLTRDQGMISI